MSDVLVISCGVADTRAALMRGDVALRFWFGPARGDEAVDRTPWLGRRFIARVSRVDASLGAAFVDLGAGAPGFLSFGKKRDAAISDGALIAVDVRAEPRRTKGAALRLIGAAPADGVIGPADDSVDGAVAAARALMESTVAANDCAIIIDDAAAALALEQAGFAQVERYAGAGCLWRAQGLDGELDAALSPIVALAGGGALTIDENEALTAIDVDTGAATGASAARLRERIDGAAARAAMRQIALRDIGGHVVIDFPPQLDPRRRKAFEESVREIARVLEGVSAASFSKSGLFTFQRRHGRASLLNRFTETDAGAPVAGRRFTLHARAVAAMRAAEAGLKAERAARFALTCGGALYDYVGAQPSWAERLAARYGARLDIRRDDAKPEREFDLGQQ